MSKTKLPPELVEKMYSAAWGVTLIVASEKQAQIAVDYAEEEKRQFIKLVYHFDMFLSGKGYCKTESEEKALLKEEIDKLLKNHEDGELDKKA